MTVIVVYCFSLLTPSKSWRVRELSLNYPLTVLGENSSVPGYTKDTFYKETETKIINWIINWCRHEMGIFIGHLLNAETQQKSILCLPDLPLLQQGSTAVMSDPVQTEATPITRLSNCVSCPHFVTLESVLKSTLMAPWVATVVGDSLPQ